MKAYQVHPSYKKCQRKHDTKVTNGDDRVYRVMCRKECLCTRRAESKKRLHIYNVRKYTATTSCQMFLIENNVK